MVSFVVTDMVSFVVKTVPDYQFLFLTREPNLIRIEFG